MCVCMLSLFSHVQLFVTLWTITHQAPLSMGFSRQAYWNGLPNPSPGDLPDPWIEPVSLGSATLADGFFTTSTTCICMGYSFRCTELNMTQWLHFHFSLSCIGEGNGNPLQCSCLENPRDRGAWWAAVCGVTQSWTWLKQLSSSSSSLNKWLLVSYMTQAILWKHPKMYHLFW